METSFFYKIGRFFKGTKKEEKLVRDGQKPHAVPSTVSQNIGFVQSQGEECHAPIKTEVSTETERDEIAGNSQPQEKEAPEKNTPPKKYKDGISKQDKFIGNILSVLRSNYRGQHAVGAGKILSIWVPDCVFFDALVEDGFKERLLTILDEEAGYMFSDVEMVSGKPSDDSNMLEIEEPQTFLQIKKKGIHSQVSRRAIVSVRGENGSLVKEQYVLDAEELSKMQGGCYNIGIGAYPQLGDGSLRENHIVIDDNPDGAQFVNNRYVSRAHAHITFSDNYGFLLHADIGGTRLAQKRTHIYRGEDKIELATTAQVEPLRDGDCIVLSKHVYLAFEAI